MLWFAVLGFDFRVPKVFVGGIGSVFPSKCLGLSLGLRIAYGFCRNLI